MQHLIFAALFLAGSAAFAQQKPADCSKLKGGTKIACDKCAKRIPPHDYFTQNQIGRRCIPRK